MSRSLSNSLSQFIGGGDYFSNPFDDNQEDSSSIVLPKKNDEIDEEDDYERKSKKKKKSKKLDDKFQQVIARGEQFKKELSDSEMIDDFDDYLDSIGFDDEDDSIRKDLIRYGRKYTRDTAVSKETSEINKTYAESEKYLNGLIKEVSSDAEDLQKDISQMRVMRTRNYKALSEMVNTKATLSNLKLGIVKEMNSMNKAKMELQMKVDKNKQAEDQDDTLVNRTIQGLFSMGRENIVTSYEDVSGSVEAGSSVDAIDYGFDEDEMIQKKYFSNNDEYEETDGDKFLKYEGVGAHYILLYDDDGNKQIITEDNQGNLIPDYPIPSNPDDLEFNISESTGTATDNLANQYELRKI